MMDWHFVGILITVLGSAVYLGRKLGEVDTKLNELRDIPERMAVVETTLGLKKVRR